MKKTLLSMALVLLSGIAMAQSTAKFTFDRNEGNPTVAVALDDVVNTEITATIAIEPNNSGYLAAINRGTETNFDSEYLNSILAINRNTTEATETDPNTYILTINNLPKNITFNKIKVSGCAINSTGQFQGLSTSRSRNFKISYGEDASGLTTTAASLLSICADDHCLGVAKTHEFDVNGKTTTGTLTIKVQIYTDGGAGCFYGLTAIEIDGIEVIPTSYTLTQITASNLMEKTTATKIAIKNLSATNNRWFVGNTSTAPYSAEDFSDAAIFIWEPVTEGQAGSYRLKKLDNTYMQTTSPKDFGTVDAAATFTATNPISSGSNSTYFNGDGDSQAYINTNDDANLVRFVIGNTWINVQNGTTGTPTYNDGKGGWTIHYVYEIAEVQEFTVNITDAQFATFFAPVNVVLPDNATAYIITGKKDENWLNLVEVTGILPANTGILLHSETEVECKLTVTDDDATAAVTDNKLSGTYYDTFIAKDQSNSYYILSKDSEGNVGMYNPVLGENTNRFKNFANKAYMTLPASQATAAFYGFDWNGTTGIDEITEQRADSKEIYDLTGRKVNAITTPGIYIVNGKKVLVK